MKRNSINKPNYIPKYKIFKKEHIMLVSKRYVMNKRFGNMGKKRIKTIKSQKWMRNTSEREKKMNLYRYYKKTLVKFCIERG